MADYDPLADVDDVPIPAGSPMQTHAKRPRPADEEDEDSKGSFTPRIIVSQSACQSSMPMSVHAGNNDLISPPRFPAIFVWDLDETLILFNSVLNGTFQCNSDVVSPEPQDMLA